MVNGTILPFTPKKGQAFTLYFTTSTSNTHTFCTAANIDSLYDIATVSKDGGSFAATTNDPEAVSASQDGIGKITLTADEMNANVVIIAFNSSTLSNGADFCVIIYTSGLTGFTAQDALKVGDIEEIKAFIKSLSNNFTEKQMLALIIKLLKS